MSRRLDIELTSTLDDGGFTWRAAGAKQPKGSVDPGVLPSESKVGDTIKVEVDQFIDGIQIVGVVHGRQKTDRPDVIELLPSERTFDPVVETRAKGGRRRDGERRGRGKGRRDGDRRDGDRRDGDRRGDRRGGNDRDGDRRGRGKGRGGPRFTPPPEVPKRPKPKRLRPGKTHRQAVLAEIPEAQQPIAELALQGMKAVRERLKADNDKAAAAGQPTMPEATVMKMAEDLLPRLRVAEWLDRAEAAQRQLANLDLRDLRSVVAAAADPAVARDESTRPLADELSAALATKQEEELQLWFGDVDAALAVGRVIRALRLSAQPPKAGVPFPVDIAERLVNSTNASLAPTDSADRWVATLEAAAFSPIHAQVQPMVKPSEINEELIATVTRLGPALPHVAALFEIEIAPDAPFPKPLRPNYGKKRKEQRERDEQRGRRKGRPDGERSGKDGSEGRDSTSQPAAAPKSSPAADAVAGDAAPEHTPVVDAAATDTAAIESATVAIPDSDASGTDATATPDTTPEVPAEHTDTEGGTEPTSEPTDTTAEHAAMTDATESEAGTDATATPDTTAEVPAERTDTEAVTDTVTDTAESATAPDSDASSTDATADDAATTDGSDDEVAPPAADG